MYQLKEIPLFFQSHEDLNNGGYPQVYPFDLYFDNELRMFRQRSTPELNALLNDIYLKGSLVEGSISSGSGEVYVEKVVDYLFEKFNFSFNPSVLEVGFGSGIILKNLKERGVNKLTGIEPGNHQRIGGLDDIRLIKDFFPSKLINEKFDLVYSLLVLEHIEDPLNYLNQLIGVVNKNGKIILAVPNCETCLEEGDLSIFIHEHFSYFTKESICALINKTSFIVEDISVIEGSFIVTMCEVGKQVSINYSSIMPNLFSDKVSGSIQRMKNLFSNYYQNEIAIYAPARAINFLYLAELTNVRLVDDSADLHGKYLPSLSSSVESLREIELLPPKIIFIFSRTFGERIKAKCMASGQLKDVVIMSMCDLDKHDAINN